MKRVVIIILALLVVSPFAFATKRAFLVGISKYKMDWPTIHGSEDVELLKRILEEEQKFKVTTLTNEQATHDGIIKGLNTLKMQIKKGDIVYIHFSAHGQPVEDYNGDEKGKKGKNDKWDEAIVPYDAGSHFSKAYNGDKHIIDDVINKYVSEMRKILGPKGALYVVIDACHAGGSSRDGMTQTRGIDKRGSSEGLSRSNKKFDFNNADDTRHYQLQNSPELAPAVFFEACTAKERNKEISVKGKEYGSLSYIVYLTLLDKKNGKIGAKPDAFERAVRYTYMNSKFWPKKQTLVTESSY